MIKYKATVKCEAPKRCNSSESMKFDRIPDENEFQHWLKLSGWRHLDGKWICPLCRRYYDNRGRFY